jgi:hypothetical protein
MTDEPPLLVSGEPCYDSLALLRPFKCQRAAHLLGDIAGLVIGKMV